MPWCPACDVYRAPSAVGGDGTCPACGGAVEPGGLRTALDAGETGEAGGGADEALPPVPWHLKLLVVAFLVYLALRGWQGVDWILDKF